MQTRSQHWLGEMQCHLCSLSFDCTSPLRVRFYCQVCRHAICLHCAQPDRLLSEKSRKRLCVECAGTGLTKEATMELRPRRWSESSCELDCSPTIPFSSAQAVQSEEDLHRKSLSTLTETLQAAQILAADMAQPLSDFNQKAEIRALKSQEKWYFAQIKQRDNEIKILDNHIQVLGNLNSDLKWKAELMERKAVQPRLETQRSGSGYSDFTCACGLF